VAPDLREQLQAHLGSTYTIERELGGGGMSRVFLARETALKRRVVIKVLPPEMAAGVNVERFRREIELAASLQHPHIVPLLSAGASGDLLYYTMPLVEGESLRAKLAREGELPVGDTIRILTDVADALAYAHAHEIIHRDIKPDNILLSGKHALVTDFGVSKAVSASSGGSLTSLGVALGTPAYMAPEQAAADPHVDHRADLYALGVLGYEMLTGQPPFVGATPQATLAAQVTKKPEPVTANREAIPAGLNALVMRCLEKHPADRWQTGAEVLQQLEAMSTPSGGTAPTGEPLPLSSGMRAALRRAHPLRVGGWFVLAALGVLAAVDVAVRGLGLPDWVRSAALALLGVGLPIMLVTGRLERRRILASTGRLAAPPQGGVAAWLTWRKATLGGVAAFAGLGLVTTGYMAMRLLGIGPVGSLVASGVLRERERLLLADFQNRSTDSTLGPSLSDAFRIDLSQSPTVRLVDPQTVTDELQRMRRAAGTTLDPALARELAVRLGIKAVLTGQIDPVGRGYVLSASLESAGDGQVLTGVRETADNEAALIPAIDHLSKGLRERIGESLRTIRANPPLERVTTGSLAALRKYSEGVRAADERFDQERAVSLLEEATALDTGFGMAYGDLANVLYNAGAGRVRIIAAATKAFEHRDRMPAVERDLTSAEYYNEVDYDLTKQIDAYRSALDLDPDNLRATEKLAWCFLRLRKWAEAESLYLRGMHLGNTWQPANGAIWAQVAEGHLVDAQATLDRYMQTSPRSSLIPQLRALIATGRGDYATAEQELERRRREQPASPSMTTYNSTALAMVAEVRGQLARAAQHHREYMAESERWGLPGQYIGGAFFPSPLGPRAGAISLAWLDLRYRHRAADGLKEVDAALKRYPLSTIPAVDRPYTSLADVFARAGRLAQAKRLLAEYETNIPEGIRRGDLGRHRAAGAVALAEGRTRDALAAYRRWYDESGCATCGLFEIATIYDRSGQQDSALATYEQIVSTPGLWDLWDNFYTLAPTYKRLGELYEARGDRAKARGYYGRFVELWKDADPELQPMVRDVRARVAQLAGEH
jgi:tetratricopeptide (TPR) repeat protein/tRNA A-37 threonylcarbamoyl transferase component Bud32